MSNVLEKPSGSAQVYDTDTPSVPWVVIGRIAAECSRIDRRFEPFLWGREMYGQELTVGSDVWSVGYTTNPKDGTVLIQVTVDGNKYGGGPRYRRTWPLSLDAVLNAPVPLPV